MEQWIETVTMLRSRDVILRWPASFLCMIHVPVSVIISVLKKKGITFYSPSYIVIVLYIFVALLSFYGIKTVLALNNKVKLAIVVEGDQKAHFSVATTPKCLGEGATPFPGLLHFTNPYIAGCWERRYQVPFLKSLVWRDLGLNPGLPDHWRTLYPLGQANS